MTPTELLREKLIVLAGGSLPLPSVAGHVAGERVLGDWSAHPKGEAIFRALMELDASAEARTCRLVSGRVTFVHVSVWPAVVRLAGDDARVRAALRGVPSTARRLHALVVDAGVAGLRVETVPYRLRVGRRHLELALLVQTEEPRREAGNRSAVLRSWEHVGTARERRAATALSLEEATDAVVEAMVGATGGAPKKELRRWIPLPAREVDFSVARLADTGRVRETRGRVTPCDGRG